MRLFYHVFISLAFLLAVHRASALPLNYLLFSPSLGANGMGQTYGPVADSSPMAVIMNPAAAGLQAQTQGFAAEFYPDVIKSDNYSGWGPTYRANSVCIGVNLKRYNVPLSLGLAYHNRYLDISKVSTDESSVAPHGSYMETNGVTMAMAFDLRYINFSLGMSFLYLRNKINYYSHPYQTGNAKDIGIIVRLPMETWYDLLLNKQERIQSPFNLFLTPGYSFHKNNIGQKISFNNRSSGSPLPRTVTTGIHVEGGIRYHTSKKQGRFLSVKWAREASDLLISKPTFNSYKYFPGLHDIDFTKHILLGKAGDDISTQTGIEINLGDVLYLRRGKYENPEEYVSIKTRGMSINCTELLSLIAMATQMNYGLHDLADTFDIVWNYTSYDSRSGILLYGIYDGISYHDLSMNSLTIRVKMK